MNLVLRPVDAADEEFLFALFVSSRDIDFSFVPQPQRSAILRMQFRAQHETYSRRYPHGVHSIICVNGLDAGRIWVAETAEEITVIDIALLPEYRNRGIGGRIYTGLIERAGIAGMPLQVTVSTANPGSLRFHERLKFRRTAADGMYISMVRQATD